MGSDFRSALVRVGWLALVVAGCASTGPAPVEDRSINRPPPPRSTPAPTRRAPATSGTYRVQRGDTLYSIAFRHGLDYRELAEWNGIEPPYTIYPGRELKLSRGRSTARPPAQAGAAARAAPPPRSATRAPETRTAAAPKPGPFEPVAPASSRSSTAATPGVSTASAAPAATPPPATASQPAGSNGDIVWHWPADGEIVGTYAAGDPTRQGIDIAGKSGSPVRAAADGTVVYSGNGLIGYGELIIVKHSPAFLSAYGHNRKRLVQEGDRVKAGQMIAEMGSSGASRDELHFEIRRNGKPSDPLGYLPRR